MEALAWMALVACEAKGTDCFEKAMRLPCLLSNEPALFEHSYCVDWPAEKLPCIKNTLNLCLAAGVTIGMAGILRGSLCTAAPVFKLFGNCEGERGCCFIDGLKPVRPRVSKGKRPLSDVLRERLLYLVDPMNAPSLSRS